MSNAILIHTGLSASSHAKSHSNNSTPGWWEEFIGPGLAIDTNKFYVICTNVLGSCYGSTGPSSLNPETALPYATTFPGITVFDMVRAQKLLLESLGIQKLHASVGSSLGGMQSLAFSALFPKNVDKCVSISACARTHPYSIALRYSQRAIVMSDPNWRRGFFYPAFQNVNVENYTPEDLKQMEVMNNSVNTTELHPPHVGMKLARMIATVGYRSAPEWELRFGRKLATVNDKKIKCAEGDEPVGLPKLCPEYLIETYLDHQGEKFCLQYDANSFLYVSKAMDMFDLSITDDESVDAETIAGKNYALNPPKLFNPHDSLAWSTFYPPSSPTQPYSTPTPSTIKGSKIATSGKTSLDYLVRGVSRIKADCLIIGVQSDILFPIAQQKEIAVCLRQCGRNVTYYELDSLYGHDTFLMDVDNVGKAVKGHLES